MGVVGRRVGCFVCCEYWWLVGWCGLVGCGGFGCGLCVGGYGGSVGLVCLVFVGGGVLRLWWCFVCVFCRYDGCE